MSRSSTTSSDSHLEIDGDLLPHDGTALLRGPVRKVTAVFVTTLFVLVTAGTGIVDGFFPVPAPKVIGKEKQAIEKRRASARLADGTLARLVEYDLRTRSRVRTHALPYYSALLYRFLREARTTAILGSDGWIFLRDRVHVDADDETRRLVLSRRILEAVSRRLRQVGSRLVVLPIPRKSVVYREKLPRVEDPRPHLYGQLLRGLAAHDVTAVDLLTPFRARRYEILFRKIDSHWNTRGMMIAAETLARTMHSRVPEDHRPYALKNMGPRRDPGDLLRLLGIERGSPAARLIDWPAYPRYRLVDGEGEIITHTPNPELPVEAVQSGTSFTHNTDFPEFVRNATGRRIWFGAWPAIGPVEPFRRTIQAQRGHPLPRTFIWEIPTHNLFSRARPLNDVGRVFSEIHGGRLPTLASFGIDVTFTRHGSLQPGTRLSDGKTLSASIARGALVYESGGGIWVRLKGRVTGGEAAVTTDTSHYRLYSRWREGSSELVLPFVGPEPVSNSAHVTLKRAGSKGEIELASMELMLDAEPIPDFVMNSGAIEACDGGYRQDILFSCPLTAGRGTAVALQLDVKGAFSRTLRLQAFGEFGAQELLDIEKITPRGAIIADLSGLEGEAIHGLRLIGIGKEPKRLVRPNSPVLLRMR